MGAMSTRPVGIDALRLYGGPMELALADLAVARGIDPEKPGRDLMVDRRSVLPPWEDAVTMAATAARHLLSEVDPARIGLLVVGTESGVDHGKPVSTLVHQALGLGSSVRNFEVKHACYSGVAALTIACDWVRARPGDDAVALVIASDCSRSHLGEHHEFVLGGAAAAAIVRASPRLLAFDPAACGTWTASVFDTFRPTARDEVGNGDLSLLTYREALEGAWRDYQERHTDAIPFAAWDRLVFHTPFAGMARQAHRALAGMEGLRGAAAIAQDFDRRVRPSLGFARRLGSPYGASIMAALASLLVDDPTLSGDARIGCFAYGSGAIGEFHEVQAMPGARAAGASAGALLEGRRRVDVSEYEQAEHLRAEVIERCTWRRTPSLLSGLYESHYEGRARLVLEEIEGFRRHYRWGDQ